MEVTEETCIMEHSQTRKRLVQLPSSNISSPKVLHGGGRIGRGPRWKLFRFPLNIFLYLALLSNGILLLNGSGGGIFVEGNSDIESCVRLMHSGQNSAKSSHGSTGSGMGGSRLGNTNNGNGLGGASLGEHLVILCQIRTLHPDLDVDNLTSSIGAGGGGSPVDVTSITKLKLVCNDVLFFESAVSPGQLSSLSELHELSIEKCKLKHLPADFLSGLGRLRRLTINTGNSDWAARSLEISPGALGEVQQLRHLHLGYNHMWNLPERLLCQVGNLQSLNLTHNLLSDIDDLGLPGSPFARVLPLQNEYSLGGGKRTSTSPVSSQTGGAEACLADLKSFDLSYNSLRTLGSRRLERMRRLQEFRVDHNWLEELEDEGLAGLGQLRLLNLSSNRLVALPQKLFQPCKLLQELDLRNNSLTALSPGLLNGLEHLQTLDLSMNSLSSQWITSEAFKSLVRLIILNLSHNQLTHLAPSTFHDLYSLQVLDLGNNLIGSIDDKTFAGMKNLHSLNLGRNRLVSINANMLNGLYVLHKLILDYNQIGVIEAGALRNCTSLQDLGLVGNQLPDVPHALRGLQKIQTLDLGENRISSLNNESFLGMSQLYGLRLVDNQLEEIPKGLCDPTPRLRVFNIAQNRIHKISSSAFISCSELKVLRLDSNKLESLPATLAPQLSNLLWLNVSENRIQWADYSLLPATLEWFDVSHNQLDTLGGAWTKGNPGSNSAGNSNNGPATTNSNHNNSPRIQNQSPHQNVRLRIVDASHNRLTLLDYHAVPASLEILRLSHNRLKKIAPDTFIRSAHLRRVELIGNQLESIPLNALRLPPIPEGRSLPEFFLGGNPFLCDCQMEWLTRINNLSPLRQQPTVLDLDAIVCRLAYSRTVTHVPLPDIKPQEFLCPYKGHCFALCQCCDFDACDCAMTCPGNCTCYHDDSWKANVVNCASSAHSVIPARLPMDSTEVYLDGNNIPMLKSHSFIGRKNLRVLYLNSSKIETISNKSFNGLTLLQNLHLENNRLKNLHGYEFDHLTKLRELYLQDNLIETISNSTFLSLKSLEVLRLDGNRLVVFTVWQLSLNSYLVEIGLARNQWNCDCQFLHQLYGWVTDNSRKVVDLGQLQCVWNTTHKPGPHLIDYNRTCGSAWALMGIDGGFDFSAMSPLPFLIGFATLVLLLIIVVVLVILFRDNARLWIFSHLGIRLCPLDYEDDKLYDAYLIYSQKDEDFVAQKVADELETNDSYRLCLHYRDLLSDTGELKESMIGAVENSKSIVIILSRNFLQGEWTSGEYRGAFHAVLKKSQKSGSSSRGDGSGGSGNVIVVFIDDVPTMEISPDIRSWVRHNRIQVIKWSVSSSDSKKHRKFWSKLKYSLPSPSSHYHSNITSNTTTTTTSASSAESGGVGGGIMATLKYTSNSENDQVIVDELNRTMTMSMNINNKLWPYATNFVALPPKYQIPNSPVGSQTYQQHQQTYNNSIMQQQILHHQQQLQSPHHHYHPPLPLSNPPKSPPSSQSTDSTTTNTGELEPLPNGFTLMMHMQGKSPVPVPKSLYSSSSHNNTMNSMGSSGGGGGMNHSLSNSNSHNGGGGGESYLSFEGEHVYSTLDPPSPQPQQVNPVQNSARALNNIHLPNGYTYQPQVTAHHPQWHPQQQGHHQQQGTTPKGTLNFGTAKSYKQKDGGGNPVQTYLV